MSVECLLDLSVWYSASLCNSGPRISLANLVAECMDGAVLNKDACLSNWEARPLSERQLKYASLDAAVLLPLFRQLHSQLPVVYTDFTYSFSAAGRHGRRLDHEEEEKEEKKKQRPGNSSLR